MQVIAIETKLTQFAFQLVRVDAEINQRADEHIAADTAEDIQIKCLFHVDADPAARALIWLAA